MSAARYGPYVQSERRDNLYRPYAEQLVREGKGLLLLLLQRTAGRPPQCRRGTLAATTVTAGAFDAEVEVKALA